MVFVPIRRSPLRISVLSALVVILPYGARSAEGDRAQSLADLGEKPSLGVEIPADLGAEAVKRTTAGGLPVESRGNWGMSPHATPEQVIAALKAAKARP
jgi:hypothetical protein